MPSVFTIVIATWNHEERWSARNDHVLDVLDAAERAATAIEDLELQRGKRRHLEVKARGAVLVKAAVEGSLRRFRVSSHHPLTVTTSDRSALKTHM